jgi:amino acid permease
MEMTKKASAVGAGMLMMAIAAGNAFAVEAL